MGILTLVLLVVLALAVWNAVSVLKGETTDRERQLERFSYLKSAGLFGLICGILWQMIGLYQAFGAIQQVESISPAMLAGGLRVSTISTIYGMLIFLLAYLVWFGLMALRPKD